MKWLSIGTNIAAIITALIAFFTLLQVQKQTEYSNRADLVMALKNEEYNLSFKEGAAFEDITFISPDSSNEIRITLVNVGNGVAKKNKIYWRINHNMLTDTIQLGDEPIAMNAYYNEDQKYVHVGDKISLDRKTEFFDFVLPINQEKTETAFRFPVGYLNQWINALAKIVNQSRKSGSCKEMVDLFLTKYGKISFRIDYEDIFQKKHAKEFRLILHPGILVIHSGSISIKAKIIEKSNDKTSDVIDYTLFDSTDNSLTNSRVIMK